MMRTNRLALPAAVVAALALAGSAQAAPKRTPLYVTAQTPPAPVLGTDGKRHLVYELLLANDGGAAATIRSVEVRSGGGRSLLRLAGDEVAQWTANFAQQGTTTLGPTEGGRMWR